MTGVVIDTSVLIAAERAAIDFARLQSSAADDVVISAVTAHELLRGLARLPLGVRRTRAERWLESLLHALPIVEYDLEIARVHAAVWADLAATGPHLGEHDQMIAATAISLGYDLATRDEAFRMVPDLDVRIW